MRLLIIDDFMVTTVTAQSAADLFEIMKAREERVPITSQLEPPTSGTLGREDELMADSILSKVTTGACHFDLDDSNVLGVLHEGTRNGTSLLTFGTVGD